MKKSSSKSSIEKSPVRKRSVLRKFSLLSLSKSSLTTHTTPSEKIGENLHSDDEDHEDMEPRSGSKDQDDAILPQSTMHRRDIALKRIVRKLISPLYLPSSFFFSLFKRLSPPLGLQNSKNFSNAEMLKVIRIAQIPVTRTGFIQYHSTLRALISLQFRVNSTKDEQEMPPALQELALDLNVDRKRRNFIKRLLRDMHLDAYLAEVIAARKIRESMRLMRESKKQGGSMAKVRDVMSLIFGSHMRPQSESTGSSDEQKPQEIDPEEKPEPMISTDSLYAWAITRRRSSTSSPMLKSMVYRKHLNRQPGSISSSGYNNGEFDTYSEPEDEAGKHDRNHDSEMKRREDDQRVLSAQSNTASTSTKTSVADRFAAATSRGVESQGSHSTILQSLTSLKSPEEIELALQKIEEDDELDAYEGKELERYGSLLDLGESDGEYEEQKEDDDHDDEYHNEDDYYV